MSNGTSRITWRRAAMAGAASLLLACAAVAADFNFDIPAGKLDAALKAYSQQTGQQLVYRAEDLQGKVTKGVKGTMSETQALEAILADTGLKVNRDASGALAVFPSEAVAGDTSTGKAGDSKELDEVLVRATAISQLSFETRTATRLDTDPMLVPMSISTVQGALLQQQQAGNITDVLNNVAGVTTSAGGGASARGFRLSGSRNGAAYTGFTDVSTVLPFRPLVATERVEVVKGPEQIMQGLVTGIGGVVNVVTKIPTPDDYLNVGGAVGSESYWRLDLDANGTLVEGKYGRVMGEAIVSVQDQGDGPFDTIGPSQDLYSAGFRWTNEEFGSDLTLVYENSTTESGAKLYAVAPSDEPMPKGAPLYLFGDNRSFVRTDSDLVELHFQQQITDSWVGELYYTWRDQGYESLEFFPIGDFNDPNIVNGLQFVNPGQSARSNSYRLNLRGTFNTGALSHKLLLGYDYMTQDDGGPAAAAVGVYQNNIPAGTKTFTPCEESCTSGYLSQTSTQTGVLLTDQFSWQKWHFLVGLRWVSYEAEYSYRGEFGEEVDSEDYDSTLPQLGVVYAVSPRLSLYASGNQGVNRVDAKDIDGNPLEDTTYDQIEGGVKYLFLDEQLALTVALYQIKQKNVPEFLGFNEETGEVYYRSIAGITSEGIDVEISGQPIRGLQLRASYAYLDSAVDKTGEPPLGGYLPNKFNVWGQYWLNREVGRGWWAGGSVAANDAMKVPPFSIGNSGSTVVDLSAGFQAEQWQAVLGVKNVADVESYYSLFPGSPIFASNYSLGERIPGREYRLDFNYRF